MTPLVSVLIVEPSEIICEGIRALLCETGRFNVLAPMHDTAQLEERLPVMRPDVLIVNPTLLSAMPKQQLAAIAQARPSMPIIALVYQYIEISLMDNFQFTIDIRSSRSALVSTVNAALDRFADEPVAADKPENYELSDRETDVLVLVAKGFSSKEIADKLHISVHTVNSHRKNITHKTGIKSVAGLTVYALLNNLLDESSFL